MREFEITLNEEEADLLIKLLISNERKCRANGDSAIRNSYGTVTAQNKKEEWYKKASESSELCSKISDRMI